METLETLETLETTKTETTKTKTETTKTETTKPKVVIVHTTTDNDEITALSEQYPDMQIIRVDDLASYVKKMKDKYEIIIRPEDQVILDYQTEFYKKNEERIEERMIDSDIEDEDEEEEEEEEEETPRIIILDDATISNYFGCVDFEPDYDDFREIYQEEINKRFDNVEVFENSSQCDWVYGNAYAALHQLEDSDDYDWLIDNQILDDIFGIAAERIMQ
ncbi:MAG: hypothetical protein DRJ64_00660 [Thermoprotei archaeon]|nr:MAG: hypothetical protein DRJ64_00660 [Thermoprotei archaeon]